MKTEKQSELEKCIWKIMSEDKHSTTFEHVKQGHKLYRCYECKGTKDSCHNYENYGRLKYGK